MPYNLNFPQPFDFMRDSQPLMLENFDEIDDFIGQDHEDFNTPNAGKHAQLTFPTQNIGALTPNEWVLFGAMYGSGPANIPGLFTKDAANILKGFDNKDIRVNVGQISWVQLPSGIIFKWVTIPEYISAPGRVLDWSILGDTKPFTQQFWSYVTVLRGPGEGPDVDPGRIAYVYDISNPQQVIYVQWFRTVFNSPVRVGGPVFILSIGV